MQCFELFYDICKSRNRNFCSRESELKGKGGGGGVTHYSSYQMGGPLNGEGAKIFKGKVDKIIVYIWVSIPFLAAPPPIYIGFSWPHPKKWIFHPHNIKFFYP